jgi:hypothetical protein
MAGEQEIAPSRAPEAERPRGRAILKRVLGWGAAVPRVLWNFRTVRLFREDRLLAVITLILSAIVLWPLFVTPILPLVDMGSHVGATGLLNDVLLRQGVAARFYEINPRIIPYWTVYFFMSLAEYFVGPFLATKLAVGGVLILLPVGAMRLFAAFGRSPRIGLFVFILSWDTNLYWGWHTFQYGMALSLIALAQVFEARTFKDGLKIIPLTVFIALTHVFAVALLGLAGGLLCLIKRPFWKTVAVHAVGLSGCLVAMLPWVYKRLEGVAPAAGKVKFDWHTPAHKIQHLYTYTLANVPDKPETSGAAFAVLWLAPAFLCLLRAREVSREQRFAPIMVVLAAMALYFTLPFGVSGPIEHWWTYPRFGTYVLIALLALPRPRLTGRAALMLIPGFAACLALHLSVVGQFKEYGRYVRPYTEIIAAMPKGVSFFPLDLDDRRFKGTRDAVLGQLHGYAAAAASSYDPHLFDQPDTPLLYRKPRKLPTINWFLPGSFTMKDHGRFYDYIIVHPLDKDPIATNEAWKKDVELVREAGQWRLYKVKRAPGASK